MTPKPVVVIPSRSPLLEAIALSVLWGAADESGTVPHPLIVCDPTGTLPPAGDAPLVFLGWRADLEESRRFAAQTLRTLTSPPSPPREVVTFEVSPRGVPFGSPEPRHGEPRADPTESAAPAPLERFVIERGPSGDSPGLLELVRARRWGAKTFAHRRPAPPAPPAETRWGNATLASPRTVPWCGTGD